METNFYPKAAESKWDDIEISPVKVIDNKGACEVCEEGEEDFWSVYLHQIDGGVKCIADLPSRWLAYQFADLILKASTKYKKTKNLNN